MRKILILSLVLLTPIAKAAWVCDYNYEAEGIKVNAVVELAKINKKESLLIKGKATNETILAYALDSKKKNRLGQLVLRGSSFVPELDMKLGILIVVPKALPGVGYLEYSEQDLKTKKIEYSEREEIKCKLQLKRRVRAS